MTKAVSDVLAESARAAKLRDRHRDYCVALAEQAEVETRGPDQAAWWQLLDTEYDNLRLALEWSLEQGSSEDALRLALAMHGVWYVRDGDETPARSWLERALAVAGDSATRLCVKAMCALGRTARDDVASGFALAQQALAVARRSGDPRAVHDALMTLGAHQYIKEIGGLKASRAVLEESLQIARELGDELAIADSIAAVGWRTSADEGLRAAQGTYDEALRLYRKLGDLENVAWQLYMIAWDVEPTVGAPLADESLAIARELGNDTLILCIVELIGWQRLYALGDYVGAQRVYEETLADYRRPGRRWPILWGQVWMLQELVEVEFQMGELEAAHLHCDESAALNAQLSAKRSTSWDLSLQGRLAAAAGDAGSARSKCAEAVEIARATGDFQKLAAALGGVADVAMWLGDYDVATAAAEERLATLPGSARVALEQLGRIRLAAGDRVQARAYFERHVESFRAMPWWRYEEPLGQLGLGAVALASGEHESASALYGAALTTLVDIGHKPYVARALEAIAGLAVEEGRLERAAKLCGAAERIREEASAKVPMDERAAYEKTLAAIKDLRTAWDEGRAMDLDPAVEYALAPSVM